MPAKIRGVKWDEVKVAVERGMELKVAAKQFKVTEAAIRCRSSREKWITERKISNAISKARNLAYRQTDAVLENYLRVEKTGVDSNNCLNVISPTSQAADYQAFVAQIAMEKVRQGLPRLKSPQNWKETATADMIARRSLGLDKAVQAQATMIRIGGSGHGGPVEVDGLQMPDEGEEMVPN